MGWLPRPAFAPLPLGSSALTPAERIARPVKTPGRQRDGLNLLLFKDVAVSGIDGIHHGTDFHRYGGAHLADLERDVDRGGAIGLNQDRGHILGGKTLVGKREGIGANRQGGELVAPIAVRRCRARELRLISDEGQSRLLAPDCWSCP
jgi:hypothetical protein